MIMVNFDHYFLILNWSFSYIPFLIIFLFFFGFLCDSFNLLVCVDYFFFSRLLRIFDIQFRATLTIDWNIWSHICNIACVFFNVFLSSVSVKMYLVECIPAKLSVSINDVKNNDYFKRMRFCMRFMALKIGSLLNSVNSSVKRVNFKMITSDTFFQSHENEKK